MLQYRFDGGWVLRIENGESVLDALTAFCEREGIFAGVFSGIGAVEGSRLGYYDHDTGDYSDRIFEDGMEVASFTGNISRKSDGTLFPHTHCVLSGRNMEAFGGHFFEGRAKPTMEIVLWIIQGELKRIPMPGKTAQVLDL